jgi:uncharacterized protein YjbI with pentapeptide repeats
MSFYIRKLSDAFIYESEKDTRRAAVEEAVKRGVDLREADLTNSDFREADLSQGSFEGANFRKSGLRGAKLRDVNFKNAILSETDLRGADLSGSDLNGTFLDGANLEDVFYEGQVQTLRWDIIGPWRVLKSARNIIVGGLKFSRYEWERFSDQELCKMGLDLGTWYANRGHILDSWRKQPYNF